jgi:hypothetical protein
MKFMFTSYGAGLAVVWGLHYTGALAVMNPAELVGSMVVAAVIGLTFGWWSVDGK